MADMVFSTVADLKAVLESSLDGYLTVYKQANYPLDSITWYDYEDAGYDHLPCGKILPEDNIVSASESGGEIFDTTVLLWVTIQCTKNRYPGSFYLYEESIRHCIWENKGYNGHFFRVVRAVYGLEREIRSVLVKSMGLTVMDRYQFEYTPLGD